MGMTLFLDACAIIYLIESQEQLGQKTRFLVTQALQNKAQLVISRLSFLECRILPLKQKDDELLLRYNEFFNLPSLHIVELTADVINLATDLRANYSSSLRTPDALQLACALKANADKFLTGDKKLASIQEIEILIVENGN
jgi:predicted nucleic acid-binding protein